MGVSSHPSLSLRLNKKMIKTSWNRMDWTPQSNEAWVLQSVMQPFCSYSDLSSSDLLCEGISTLFTSHHLIKENWGLVCLMCFACPVVGFILLNDPFMQICLHANKSLFVLERKTPGTCDQMFPGSKNRFLYWDLNLQKVISDQLKAHHVNNL